MTDYNTLASDVAQWLVGHDLNGTIDSFIALAEDRHRDDIRVRAMVKRVDITGVDSFYLPLPEDFIDARRVKFENDRRQLIQVSPEAMSNRRDVRSLPSSPNLPVYWANAGTELEFDVELTAASTVELQYWAAFPRISAGSPNNWLVANGYGAYLYGTLMEAAPYIDDPERLTMWAAAYGTHVTRLNEEYRKSLAGGAPRVTVEDAGVLP